MHFDSYLEIIRRPNRVLAAGRWRSGERRKRRANRGQEENRETGRGGEWIQASSPPRVVWLELNGKAGIGKHTVRWKSPVEVRAAKSGLDGWYWLSDSSDSGHNLCKVADPSRRYSANEMVARTRLRC